MWLRFSCAMCGSVLNFRPHRSLLFGSVSPVEAMAKARHDRLHLGPNAISWESMPPDYRRAMMREAASDLLALAEVIHPVLW
jgi:hypothetical protein